MLQAVAGTALVAAGAAVLNQVAERDTDALMRRTRGRALPDGRVPPGDARLFGIVLSAGGLALLAALPHLLAAGLALATLILYLAVYTPLKRRTPLATLVGAVPGALPPLIGWTAAHGSISLGGAALFAIVFLWQIPHFMAIAWMYRDDYAKAGFPMLPVVDPAGRRAGRQAVVYAAALIPVSVVPALAGVSGTAYLVAALALGIVLLWLAIRFAATRTDRSARRLFFGSITYLPVLLDRDDREPAVTVQDLPAVNASLNALSGILLLIGYVADSRAPDRAASPLHDRGVRHLVGVSRVLRRVSRAGRIGAVHAAGLRAAGVFHDSRHARHARGGGRPAGRSSRCRAACRHGIPSTSVSPAGRSRSGCMSR